MASGETSWEPATGEPISMAAAGNSLWGVGVGASVWVGVFEGVGGWVLSAGWVLRGVGESEAGLGLQARQASRSARLKRELGLKRINSYWGCSVGWWSIDFASGWAC